MKNQLVSLLAVSLVVVACSTSPPARQATTAEPATRDSTRSTLFISDEQLTLVGDTAVLIGKLEIDGEMSPVGRLPPMKFMAVFVREEAEWKLLARSLTPCFPLAVERGLC